MVLESDRHVVQSSTLAAAIEQLQSWSNKPDEVDTYQVAGIAIHWLVNEGGAKPQSRNREMAWVTKEYIESCLGGLACWDDLQAGYIDKPGAVLRCGWRFDLHGYHVDAAILCRWYEWYLLCADGVYSVCYLGRMLAARSECCIGYLVLLLCKHASTV